MKQGIDKTDTTPFKNFDEVVAHFKKHGELQRPCQWIEGFKFFVSKTKAIVSNAKQKFYYYPDGRVVIKKVPNLRSSFRKRG